MSFFKSDIVKQEIKEIAFLQERIASSIFSVIEMSKEEKLEHINILEELLNKQKILYTRLSLSDDPDAVELKQKMNQTAHNMGLTENYSSVSAIFSNMTDLISRLKDQLQDE